MRKLNGRLKLIEYASSIRFLTSGPVRLVLSILVLFILVVSFHSEHSLDGTRLDLLQMNYDSFEAPAIDMGALKARQRDKLAQLRREVSLPQIPQPPTKLRKGIRNALAYYYPYTEEIREAPYPGFIWQTWKYAPDRPELDPRHSEWIKEWTEKHSGYVHQVLDDAFAMKLIKYLYKDIPDIIKTYEAFDRPVMRADFFRYLILFARGGVYSDIDTIPLKAANDWVPPSIPLHFQGMVIGVEADLDKPDWHKFYARRLQFVQWTIKSKPGHPILREVIARVVEEVQNRKHENLIKDIMDITGPGIWTDSIFDYFSNPEVSKAATGDSNSKIGPEYFFNLVDITRIGDVVVLPITGFSPGQNHMGSKPNHDPMAMVYHFFGSSWK